MHDGAKKLPQIMYNKPFLVALIFLVFSTLSWSKHQDLSLIAPAEDIKLPDPEINIAEKKDVPHKPLTTLEMSENFNLQPRLEYDDYFNIKPTKPQTFGLNFNWDI